MFAVHVLPPSVRVLKLVYVRAQPHRPHLSPANARRNVTWRRIKEKQEKLRVNWQQKKSKDSRSDLRRLHIRGGVVWTGRCGNKCAAEVSLNEAQGIPGEPKMPGANLEHSYLQATALLQTPKTLGVLCNLLSPFAYRAPHPVSSVWPHQHLRSLHTLSLLSEIPSPITDVHATSSAHISAHVHVI